MMTWDSSRADPLAGRVPQYGVARGLGLREPVQLAQRDARGAYATNGAYGTRNVGRMVATMGGGCCPARAMAGTDGEEPSSPKNPPMSKNLELQALMQAVDAAQGLDAKLAAAHVEDFIPRASGHLPNVATAIVLGESDAVTAHDLCVLTAGLNGTPDSSIVNGPFSVTVQKVCNDPSASLVKSLNRIAEVDKPAAARLAAVMKANAKAVGEAYNAKLVEAFTTGFWNDLKQSLQFVAKGASDLGMGVIGGLLPLALVLGGVWWLVRSEARKTVQLAREAQELRR